MISIIDYGAVNDGKTLCTKNIQAAIDACSKDGGMVYIPTGKYLTGTLHLCDNIHICLESGAMLLGSRNTRDDFEPDEERDCPLYQDTSHSFYNHSLFVAKKCKNITFSGFGTIDMQSAWEMDERDFGPSVIDCKRGAKTLTFVECENVVVRDLTLLNSTDLTLYLLGCENVRIHGLNIVGHIDGISPDACKNVVISDCIVKTGDDGIVMKSSYSLSKHKFCENVSITNCIVSSRCSAIKFGTESNAGYRNITVSNCAVENTRLSALALEIADGGIMEDITISNISMRNVGTPLFIVLCKRGRGPGITKNGIVRNIYINNLIATGPYEPWEACVHDYFHQESMQEPEIMTSSITGLKNQKIDNVTLSNVYIEVPGGEIVDMKNYIVPENETGYPENNMYGNLSAYGLYCRHCEGLTLHNVKFKAINEDKREAIVLDDVVS